MGSDRAPIIAAVADSDAEADFKKTPLLLIHGINGNPADMQDLANRYRSSPHYQVYVLAYDDSGRRISVNGKRLAPLLESLGGQSSADEIVVIAHSLGGVVLRQALNELATRAEKSGPPPFRIRAIAIDSPWHGYRGPADGPLMSFVSLFMPEALYEMRALSSFFTADSDSLYDRALPAWISLSLYFAQEGKEVFDYTEPVLGGTAEALQAAFTPDRRADFKLDAQLPQVRNFLGALFSSAQFPAFAADMSRLGRENKLTPESTLTTLQAHFRRFPGNHLGVLKEHPGQASFADFTQEFLGEPASLAIQ